MVRAPKQGAGTLSLRGVGCGYGGTFRLEDVSLELEPGSVMALIGPNGSGKSTLLKTIAGVNALRAGTMSLSGGALRERAAEIAFVPQREDVNWGFPVTAADVVLMGRYRRIGWVRRPGKPDRELAAAALARMGLAGREHQHISEFSGGQQQRIFLARAMVQEPALVLLDEPFTGIDAENRAVLHAVIQEFAAAGVSVLVATHDLEEAADTCSHVLALNGRVVAFGRSAEVLTRDVLRQTFGGQVAILAEGR